MLKYRTGLKDMPSYDVVERDWQIKVNANECNMNLPPMVEDRVMGRLSRVAFNRYPNEDLEMLMEAIGRNFGLGVENVLIGNGSSEIIEKIFYCFGGRGRKIVFPQPSFSMYHIYAKAAEAEAVPVSLSEKDYSLDVKEFVNVVNDNKAALCVIGYLISCIAVFGKYPGCRMIHFSVGIFIGDIEFTVFCHFRKRSTFFNDK